ncbi:copper chaperone CopZ [Staphylococcus simiae]|uniref:copper chaperone CopZ n=1 Tax=Staphylococcus simiae TaxID=308354 RepID=UPI001A95B9B0|nr:copper chaperone CopZ [Staphylococcus simiae]MBO1198178.1 copper chaperone CopZ [Staphylococcus simiae]MBO1200278.1 copper chaperone CopZ [Staphylococcus simiae]MBO1202558.1 copper chaperone CopZ [Staphylococcus simiae]MBO1210164.1 copper chaperone CopZ [Staphylococcus simiae]MBO1228702.1 copper chaperone CopZ [Staphylococcus simiae]
MAQDILKVEGMSCAHCKSAVESALTELNGVDSAQVNLEQGNVEVQYDDSQVSTTQMKDAIEDQGYDVV